MAHLHYNTAINFETGMTHSDASEGKGFYLLYQALLVMAGLHVAAWSSGAALVAKSPKKCDMKVPWPRRPG